MDGHEPTLPQYKKPRQTFAQAKACAEAGSSTTPALKRQLIRWPRTGEQVAGARPEWLHQPRRDASHPGATQRHPPR